MMGQEKKKRSREVSRWRLFSLWYWNLYYRI